MASRKKNFKKVAADPTSYFFRGPYTCSATVVKRSLGYERGSHLNKIRPLPIGISSVHKTLWTLEQTKAHAYNINNIIRHIFNMDEK